MANKLIKTATGYNVSIDGDVVASISRYASRYGKQWDWTWSDAIAPSDGFDTLRQVRDYMDYKFPQTTEIFGFDSQADFDAAVAKWNAENANK